MKEFILGALSATLLTLVLTAGAVTEIKKVEFDRAYELCTLKSRK